MAPCADIDLTRFGKQVELPFDRPPMNLNRESFVPLDRVAQVFQNRTLYFGCRFVCGYDADHLSNLVSEIRSEVSLCHPSAAFCIASYKLRFSPQQKIDSRRAI